MKIGNFPWIIIRVLGITGSVGFYDNFHILYIFPRIFKNRELRENIYSAKMSVACVTHLGVCEGRP